MSKWFYHNDSGVKIEVTGGQLKWLAKNGKITRDTIVETEEGKSAPARKVKGLTFVVAPPIKNEGEGFESVIEEFLTAKDYQPPVAEEMYLAPLPTNPPMPEANQTITTDIPVPIVAGSKSSSLVTFIGIASILTVCTIGGLMIYASERKQAVQKSEQERIVNLEREQKGREAAAIAEAKRKQEDEERERIATEQREQEEQEHQRIVAEQREQEEREHQRIAAMQREREEQERQRLAAMQEEWAGQVEQQERWLAQQRGIEARIARRERLAIRADERAAERQWRREQAEMEREQAEMERQWIAAEQWAFAQAQQRALFERMLEIRSRSQSSPPQPSPPQSSPTPATRPSMASTSSAPSTRQEKCSNCGGIGRNDLDCSLCKGTGKSGDHTICKACAGIGFPPCKRCKGSGWITK